MIKVVKPKSSPWTAHNPHISQHGSLIAELTKFIHHLSCVPSCLQWGGFSDGPFCTTSEQSLNDFSHKHTNITSHLFLLPLVAERTNHWYLQAMNSIVPVKAVIDSVTFSSYGSEIHNQLFYLYYHVFIAQTNLPFKKRLISSKNGLNWCWVTVKPLQMTQNQLKSLQALLCFQKLQLTWKVYSKNWQPSCRLDDKGTNINGQATAHKKFWKQLAADPGKFSSTRGFSRPHDNVKEVVSRLANASRLEWGNKVPRDDIVRAFWSSFLDITVWTQG